MPSPFGKEYGTLIIAALLLLSLGFAGYWIISYLRYGGADWSTAYWFVASAGVVVVVGILANIFLAERSARH